MCRWDNKLLNCKSQIYLINMFLLLDNMIIVLKRNFKQTEKMLTAAIFRNFNFLYHVTDFNFFRVLLSQLQWKHRKRELRCLKRSVGRCIDLVLSSHKVSSFMLVFTSEFSETSVLSLFMFIFILRESSNPCNVIANLLEKIVSLFNEKWSFGISVFKIMFPKESWLLVDSLFWIANWY